MFNNNARILKDALEMLGNEDSNDGILDELEKIIEEDEDSETNEQDKETINNLRNELTELTNDEEVKKLLETCEVDNYPEYIKMIRDEIINITETFNNRIAELDSQKVSDFTNNEELNNVNEILKKKQQVKDKIIAKYKITIDELNFKIECLQRALDFKFIDELGFGYGKFKLDKYTKYYNDAYKKLEKSTLEFPTLDEMMESLEDNFIDEEIISNFLMKFYMFICFCKKKYLLFVYFVMVSIINLNHPKINIDDKLTILDSINRIGTISTKKNKK